MPHSEHLKGFSLAWIFSCSCSRDLWAKLFPQMGHVFILGFGANFPWLSVSGEFTLFETKSVFLVVSFPWIGVLEKFLLAEAKDVFAGYLWGGTVTPWKWGLSERENSSHLKHFGRSSVPSLCGSSWVDLLLFKEILWDSSSFCRVPLPRVRLKKNVRPRENLKRKLVKWGKAFGEWY